MDIRLSNVAQSLIDEIDSQQFVDRRTEEYKSYKIAEGGQLAYIKDRLLTLFPKSHHTMRVSDVSLSAKILSKIAKAYKESPIRDFEGQTDKMNDIFNDGEFDSRMAEFDRDFNRQKYGLFWVNKIEEDISFHSLKGFESFVKVDKNTGKMKAVVLNYPDINITSNSFSDGDQQEQTLQDSQDDTSAESRVYAMWTADFHAIWRVTEKTNVKGGAATSRKLENVPIEGNEAMSNDLGVLPFVYRSKSSSPDLPFLNPITEQSLMYNTLNSDLLTASALQGYGQLVMSMPEDQAMSEMHTGMTTAITIPIVQGAEAQADAKYINANPDLKGMMDTINNYVSDIVSEHLGESQSSGSEKFSSGLERLIANATVTDQVSMNQAIYAKMEKEIIDIIIAYGDLAESKDGYTVIFPKAKVMISDKETLENIKMRMDMGLMTRTEALMVIDPNLGETAADKKLEEIDKKKQEAIQTFMGEPNANNQDKDQLQPQPFGEVKEG